MSFSSEIIPVGRVQFYFPYLLVKVWIDHNASDDTAMGFRLSDPNARLLVVERRPDLVDELGRRLVQQGNGQFNLPHILTRPAGVLLTQEENTATVTLDEISPLASLASGTLQIGYLDRFPENEIQERIGSLDLDPVVFAQWAFLIQYAGIRG